MSMYETTFLTDSAADLTTPMGCNTLRKGGYVLMKGSFPCKIVDIATSKPGKHGSAKAHIIGIDIFSGKRCEEIFTTHSRVSVPNVKRSEHEISFVNHEGYISIFNDDMTIRSDLQWTEACDTPLENIQAFMVEAEADTDGKIQIIAVVYSAMGRDLIREVRMKKDN